MGWGQGRGIGRNGDPPPQVWHKGSGRHRARPRPHRGVQGKDKVTADQCDQQGIAFIPVVAESLSDWHKVGLEQLRKLGSALARHTGQEEGETISHLLTRASVLLQKGLSALLLNRIPCHTTPAIGAQCV